MFEILHFCIDKNILIRCLHNSFFTHKTSGQAIAVEYKKTIKITNITEL